MQAWLAQLSLRTVAILVVIVAVLLIGGSYLTAQCISRKANEHGTTEKINETPLPDRSEFDNRRLPVGPAQP